MPFMQWKRAAMTPKSVINDLVYVERYHRSHGAPYTADIMVRARSLIHKQSLALGTLDTDKPEPIMVVLVSDIKNVFSELERLRAIAGEESELVFSKSFTSI